MPNISLERESSVHPKYVERKQFYNYDIRAWLFDIFIVVNCMIRNTNIQIFPVLDLCYNFYPKTSILFLRCSISWQHFLQSTKQVIRYKIRKHIQNCWHFQYASIMQNCSLKAINIFYNAVCKMNNSKNCHLTK